jgi:hypothetical protein
MGGMMGPPGGRGFMPRGPGPGRGRGGRPFEGPGGRGFQDGPPMGRGGECVLLHYYV